MGKPYGSEISNLSRTLNWAGGLDVTALCAAIRSAGSLPLLAVGSGGSLTAAHLLTSLHTAYAGRIATVLTPLEAVKNRLERNVSVWLLSANGRNVDILAALSAFAKQEPKQLGVMCGRPNSPLSKEARRHYYVDLFDFILPTGKDGFLATNSLLAFTVLIGRAFLQEYEKRPLSLNVFDWLVGDDKGSVRLESVRTAAATLWKRDTVIVLHDSNTRIGAVDLESKFTESALGHVQIADFRNFAHGRHHWLAKRGQSSGVLALVSPQSRDLAKRTLALIPKKIPVVRLDFDGGLPEAAIASLLIALHVTGWVGRATGIDPGRPGVPEFGRKLYNLAFPRPKRVRPLVLSVDDEVAIERKSGVDICRLEERGDLLNWREALNAFKKQLSNKPIDAVVFDYDGTLVDVRNRFRPPTNEIQEELIRLLEAGLVIGIASGRGGSIREDLRKSVPESLSSRVVLGYYNGAEIGLLNDDAHPGNDQNPVGGLADLATMLRTHSELKEIAVQSDRRCQLTLKPRIAVPENRLWDIANQIVLIHGLPGVQIVRSSHSIDILAPGISKCLVLRRVSDICGGRANTRILKIGDRGQWPGNDFELLREPLSLSVDEISIDPATCWNLAPRGQRGVQATLHYCKALQIHQGAAWFNASEGNG